MHLVNPGVQTKRHPKHGDGPKQCVPAADDSAARRLSKGHQLSRQPCHPLRRRQQTCHPEWRIAPSSRRYGYHRARAQNLDGRCQSAPIAGLLPFRLTTSVHLTALYHAKRAYGNGNSSLCTGGRQGKCLWFRTIITSIWRLASRNKTEASVTRGNLVHLRRGRLWR